MSSDWNLIMDMTWGMFDDNRAIVAKFKADVDRTNDLTKLNNLVEKLAHNSQISNKEYEECYAYALRKIQKGTHDGGEGSGNFGHAGRPGKIGGSAPAENASWKPHAKKVDAPEEIKVIARKCIENAHAPEPEVTMALKSFAAETGGEMAGLDFKFKGEGSLARKLRDKSVQKHITPEEYSNRVTDVLRYTTLYTPEKFAESFKKFAEKLKKAGYNILEVTNSLPNVGSAYRGINTVIRTPAGYKFELQFHTPQSFDIKEHYNHKAYEVYRDPGEKPARRKAAENYCKRNAAKIVTPDNAELIESFEVK